MIAMQTAAAAALTAAALITGGSPAGADEIRASAMFAAAAIPSGTTYWIQSPEQGSGAFLLAVRRSGSSVRMYANYLNGEAGDAVYCGRGSARGSTVSLTVTSNVDSHERIKVTRNGRSLRTTDIGNGSQLLESAHSRRWRKSSWQEYTKLVPGDQSGEREYVSGCLR